MTPSDDSIDGQCPECGRHELLEVIGERVVCHVLARVPNLLGDSDGVHRPSILLDDVLQDAFGRLVTPGRSLVVVNVLPRGLVVIERCAVAADGGRADN